MAVDQASYRPWDGTARPTRRVIVAIAQTMIRRLMKLRLVRWMVKVVIVCATAISAMIFGLGALMGEGPMGGVMQRAPDIDQLALANRLLAPALGLFAVLMAAIVGAPLIAEDRRARALPLYFSRPITHFDYVAGKLVTLIFFLGLLLLLPPIAMYLVEAAFSTTEGTAWKHLPTLLHSLEAGLVGCVVLGALALGVSSLTERPNHAALLFLGLIILTGILTDILAFQLSGAHNAEWLAVSPNACIRRIGNDLLPLPDLGLKQLRDPINAMPVGAAWTGAAVWTGIGLGLLVVRIRKVEVVA